MLRGVATCLLAAGLTSTVAMAGVLSGAWNRHTSEWAASGGSSAEATTAARAHFLAGRVHARDNRHDEAIAVFSRVIELRPDYALTYIHRAHAYFNMHQPAEAVLDYTTFVALRPGEPNAYWGRAQAHNATGDHRAAIVDADAALAIDPKLAGAHYQRALAWHRLGNHPAALSDVEAGLAIDPDDACLKGLLAALQGALQDGQCEALVALLDSPLKVADLLTAIR